MPTNPWDAYPTVQQGQAPAGGPIYSPPKQPDAPNPGTGYQMLPGGTAAPIPGGPADPNAGAVDTPGDIKLTGDDYLKTLEPGLAGQVKALADGRRAFPTGTALKDPAIRVLIAAATQYDPSLDAANASTRVATRKDFTSGVTAKNITSINTALGHLGSLKQAADELHNRGVPLWNTIANAAESATGDPRVNNFNLKRQAVVDELERVFRGAGGGTEAGIDSWKQAINSSQSPEQLNKAIQSGIELLDSRLQSLGDQYQRGMGQSKDPITLLAPHAQAVYQHLGPGGDGKLPPGFTDGGSTPDNPGGDPYGGKGKQIEAFWNSHRNNPNLTVDQATQFYASLGGTADPAMIAKAVDDAKKGNKFVAGEPQAAPQQASPFVASIGDIAQGVGDVVGIVGNPVNAAINAATGTNLSTDLGETLRTDILGIPHGNKTMEAVNRFGTAALTGSLGARSAAELANPGVVKNALAVIGKTPIRDTVAGMAAGAGGQAGKASGIPGGEIAGNLLGGMAGYGAASGVNALAGAARGGTVPNALAGAAQRQGVDLLPADAGGPVAKAVTTGTKASPLSVGPVVRAAQRQQGQMGDAARRTAESQGEIVTTDRAGQSVANAAKDYSKTTSQRGGRMYDKAFAMAKGVTIVPKGALDALDAQIARVKENPAAADSTLSELTTLRNKIAKGVSIQGLRDARTELSQGTYNGKLRSTADKQRYKDTLDAIAGDIHAGLVDAGKPEAAALFKSADTFWKGRVEHIDEVLQPILGNNGTKSGEDIVKSVEAMARGGQGGNARLSRLLANMPDNEAGQVRAVIIDRIGKASPGAQSAAGDTFSAGTFLTNWNKMTPQAKASLFADKGLRQNLDDLANLAGGMKASQAMANHSNTGAALVSNVGAGVALAAAHPVGVLFGAGAQYLTGKLMASPAFARLLARSAKMPPQAAARTMGEQLGVIAAREPLIANDAQGLQQYLSQAFAQSPTRAAAQGQQEQQRR